jgi:hypothetical protein
MILVKAASDSRAMLGIDACLGTSLVQEERKKHVSYHQLRFVSNEIHEFEA